MDETATPGFRVWRPPMQTRTAVGRAPLLDAPLDHEPAPPRARGRALHTSRPPTAPSGTPAAPDGPRRQPIGTRPRYDTSVTDPLP
ncbi:hypothetical protein [Streptomyces sp. enrichment culture]|uniref:hypothetical protein n=1 Tax=Streptomyces sp. enrichment culture TaxID=1795815 RepID=UPI003F57DF5C